MDELRRFSSRRQRLDHAFLNEKLRGARSYDRIAGYFRSSIFELVGEEISDIGRVRIVANADLDPEDIAAAQRVRVALLFRKFVQDELVVEAAIHRGRYRQLYDLLISGK